MSPVARLEPVGFIYDGSPHCFRCAVRDLGEYAINSLFTWHPKADAKPIMGAEFVCYRCGFDAVTGWLEKRAPPRLRLVKSPPSSPPDPRPGFIHSSAEFFARWLAGLAPDKRRAVTRKITAMKAHPFTANPPSTRRGSEYPPESYEGRHEWTPEELYRLRRWKLSADAELEAYKKRKLAEQPKGF